jgi:hypothetical protein
LFGISALLVAFVMIPRVGWPEATLSVIVALAAGLCLAMGGRRDRGVQWALAADHRGRRTVLFVSTDRREFDQVCRALRRATERLTDEF